MKRYTRINVEVAARLYTEGLTAREIASRIGCSKSGAIRALRINGYQIRAAERREPPVGPKHPSWSGGRWLDGDGYFHVWTPNGYRQEHRIVAQAKPGEVVHHIDGNRQNNDPANLRVLPGHAEHLKIHQPTRRRPAPLRGEDNPRSKLTEDDVRAIRSLQGALSSRDIAANYGVSKTTINSIFNHKLWKCIA